MEREEGLHVILRFQILLCFASAGPKWPTTFCLCATALGLFPNQPVHETRAMAHSQSAPCPGAKMMGSRVKLESVIIQLLTLPGTRDASSILLNWTTPHC